MTDPTPQNPYPAPAVRRLRVYSFDPQASVQLSSVRYAHATLSLPWEERWEAPLEPGPKNDYLEVIDVDPASKQFYAPVDLSDPHLLAQDGLTPSEGNPQFHQQMVFAVAMKTVRLFERALGRRLLWAPSWNNEQGTYMPRFRLRIYPHALREANAYYSRNRHALLFGYFRAPRRDAGASWIFTVLSHDIIVHETTHAILDGLHRRYAEATSVDSLAFHEGFADIVALFSHFMIYEAVYDHIARSKGVLDKSGLLSGLAGQFAMGTTGRSALREFIGSDPTPEALEAAHEAHDRGAILVAAVFDAFLTIYDARTEDLLRIAGITDTFEGHLHPDLVARLAREACKSADHVLRMCIRALDYLPPVDVHFGEYLRGIITGDFDLVPDDRLNYRLAFIEAFRRRGIVPPDCLSMSPDNLLWEVPDPGTPLDMSGILEEGLDLVPRYDRREMSRVAEINRKKVWYWMVQPEYVIVRDNAGKSKIDSNATAELQAFLKDIRLTLAAYAPDPQMLPEPISANPVTRVLDAHRRSIARPGYDKEKLDALIKDLKDIEPPEAPAERSLPSGKSSAEVLEDRRQDFVRYGLDEKRLSALIDKLNDKKHFNPWLEILDMVDDATRIRQDGWAIVRDVKTDTAWQTALGIVFDENLVKPRQDLNSLLWRPVSGRWDNSGKDKRWWKSGPIVEVHSVRTTRRSGPDGQDIRQLVIEVTQQRRAYLTRTRQEAEDRNIEEKQEPGEFVFRGGATLIVDLRHTEKGQMGELRYIIRKNILDDKRLEAQRQFLSEPMSFGMTYDKALGEEPFAMVHQCY